MTLTCTGGTEQGFPAFILLPKLLENNTRGTRTCELCFMFISSVPEQLFCVSSISV